MAKVTINSTEGLKQEAGDGLSIEMPVQFSAGNGWTMNSVTISTAAQASGSVIAGGLYLISASDGTTSPGGGLTVRLPLASSVPGAMFVFRNTSVNPHIISASRETGGTLAIVGLISRSLDTNFKTPRGSGLTMASAVGSSAVMVCDGVSFLVLNTSGSAAPSGG